MRRLLFLMLLCTACSDPDATDGGGPIDTGVGAQDSGVVVDSGQDSGSPDAQPGDLGSDAGPTDVGPTDNGGTDTGNTDTGGADTGNADSGNADSGNPDSGDADSGGGDSGAPDTGTATFGCGLPPPPYVAGELTCPTCPAANPPPASFLIQAGAVTHITLTGNVTGSTGDGQFFVIGTATTAGQLFGSLPVNGGNYSVDVPLFCGTQFVLLVFCNAGGTDVITYEITTDNCVEPDVRATISWDALGDDWELHLIKPGGQINDNATDCTWTSCIPTGPDWGVVGDPADNPAKDVDDVDGYGPENIIMSGPENGTYTVMVEHWGSGDPGSDGFVILNVGGQTYVVDLLDFAPQYVRTAFTITYPGGLVATSTVLYNCGSNWSGGCRDPIP